MKSAPGLAALIKPSFTWYGANTLSAHVGFGFLSHRRPRVGVDGIGAGDGIGRVAEEPQAARRAAPVRRLLDDRRRQLIARGACDVAVDAEHRRGMRQRRGDVVAVADEGQRAAGERSEPFLQRDEISQRLARMLFVGQRVDHVEALGRRREFFERPLRERPDDDGMDPALEISGDVGDRLAASQRHVGLQRDDLPARARAPRFQRWSASEATAFRTASPRSGPRARGPSGHPRRARAPPSFEAPARGSVRDRRPRGR